MIEGLKYLGPALSSSARSFGLRQHLFQKNLAPEGFDSECFVLRIPFRWRPVANLHVSRVIDHCHDRWWIFPGTAQTGARKRSDWQLLEAIIASGWLQDLGSNWTDICDRISTMTDPTVSAVRVVA
mmetsp:Transcript_33459/g.73119  ORF Transcript_33459/g.73119 Transcript_33459/m.73119 type:complete len:126 (+) Transcript_33459:223-600(+)